MKLLTAFVLLFAAAAASACNNGSSSPTLAPASNTIQFTGTVPACNPNPAPCATGVSQLNTFSVAQEGAVNVTLLSAGPPPTITEGLGLGTPGGGTCSIASGNAVSAVASSTAQLTFSDVPVGTYCVEVFDIGNQLSDITYTVSVAHP